MKEEMRAVRGAEGVGADMAWKRWERSKGER